MQLGDCPCQMLSIGAFHLFAIDYGDAINLNEKMQQRLTAFDKEKRNQCALLDVSDGVIALDLKHKTARLALGLRELQMS